MQQQQFQQGQRKNSSNKTTETTMTQQQPRQHRNMMIHNMCQIERNNDVLITAMLQKNATVVTSVPKFLDCLSTVLF